MSEELQAYHLRSCHSRTAWFKGQKDPFPCDCGLEDALSSHNQQIALESQERLSNEYQRGRNSVGGESVGEAWERGRRAGMRTFELHSDSEYFKTRESVIGALCAFLWMKTWDEAKGNQRRFEAIMGFMRHFDSYVDKRIEESYKLATLKSKKEEA